MTIGVIMVLSLIALSPSLKDGFTNWDDTMYVSNNPLVTHFTLNNLGAHFTQFYMGHYHPLTMISLMFDHLAGGNHPFIYHFVNVLLHLLSTALVFAILLLMTKDRRIAIVASLLFGIHPLHVESVTWISERKDVLYGFFYLASLLSYVYYIQRNKSGYYILALLLFVFSVLSKAQGVSLAIVIIFTDYLLQRKPLNMKLILEKIPFLVIALVIGYISTKADKTNIFVEGLDKYSFLERILLASYSFSMYLWKLVLPLHLSAWYPYPYVSGTQMPGWLWVFPLIPVSFLFVIYKSYRNNRLLTFSLLFFAANIITMLQVFPMRDAVIADRYCYMASIGFFIAAAFLYRYLQEKKPASAQTFRNAGIAIVVFYGILTFARTSVWKDSISLWEDTIDKYPGIALVHLNYGKALNDQPDSYDKALAQYDIAIRLNPTLANAYNDRAVLKDENGYKEAAIEDYNKAIALKKDYAVAYSNKAMAEKDLKLFDEALADIGTAIRLKPGDANFFRYRGRIRMAQQQYSEAIRDFDIALKYDPQLSYAWSERGTARHFLKDYPGAIRDYDKAISIKDDYAESYFNRAAAKMKVNDVMGACGDLRKAAELGNENAKSIYDQSCR